MPIKINGATSGSVTVQAPATGSDVTLTLPGATGTVPLLGGSNTWTGTQNFTGATVTGGGLDFITSSSFSAAASVSVNNCFTASYENYMIVMRHTGSTALAARIRMRVGGVDDSSANYHDQGIFASSTSTTAGRATGATSGDIFGSPNTTAGYVTVYINSPAAASPTLWQSTAANVAPGSGVNSEYWVGGHNVSTAYDGFSIIPSTGTITGSLRVYGLRNS